MRRAVSLVFALAALSAAAYDPLSIGGEWLINSYKQVISPLQGKDMCNFWPTCSQFTRGAIREQGFFPGVVIGADRLMRCHNFAWSGYDKHYFGISHKRLNDPVDNHVAWLPPGSDPDNLTVLSLDQDDIPSPRGTTPSGPGDVDFARHLYSTGDFGRAALEFTRAAYAADQGPVRTFAGLMSGESFLKTGDYEDARNSFASSRARDAHDLAQYGTARAWFSEGDYERARKSLDSIAPSGLERERLALTGWSLYKEFRFSEAAALFALADDPELATLAASNGRDLPHRNRTLGTLLSAILPGAGQAYAGRMGDGVYALLTVAGSGFLTWWFAAEPARRDRTRIKVSVFGALTALFYSANVYGASIAARDYNSLQQRRYLARVEPVLHKAGLEPDYSWLLPSESNDALPSPPEPVE